jgi:sugar-specific transcriptional regulator TrmB
MQDKHLSRLEKMGLFRAEAQIYLTLLRNSGPMRASDIVAAAGVPRGSIYAALTRLTDIGLVEAEEGYGGRFSAVAAAKALPLLVARHREELLQCEQVASELAQELKSVGEPNGLDGELELIQVLRDPRVCTERFERLQLEAKQEIDVFVKYPILNPRHSNPSEKRALKKGVRNRALYERAIVDAPEIKPYLSKWIAFGEEARVYDGELPHKLAIFDRQNILMPLVMGNGQMRVLFIRHPQLAASLTMLFEFLWERAKPITAGRHKAAHSSDSLIKTANKRKRIRATSHFKPTEGVKDGHAGIFAA